MREEIHLSLSLLSAYTVLNTKWCHRCHRCITGYFFARVSRIPGTTGRFAPARVAPKRLLRLLNSTSPPACLQTNLPGRGERQRSLSSPGASVVPTRLFLFLAVFRWLDRLVAQPPPSSFPSLRARGTPSGGAILGALLPESSCVAPLC